MKQIISMILHVQYRNICSPPFRNIDNVLSMSLNFGLFQFHKQGSNIKKCMTIHGTKINKVENSLLYVSLEIFASVHLQQKLR